MGRRIFKSSAQTDLLMFVTHHVPLISTIWSWKKAHLMFCAWHWDELTPPVFLKQHNVCRAPIKPTTTINKIHLVHLFVWGFFYVDLLSFWLQFWPQPTPGGNIWLFSSKLLSNTHVSTSWECAVFDDLEAKFTGPAANFSISPTYKKLNPRMMMKLLMRHQQLHWYVLLIIN